MAPNSCLFEETIMKDLLGLLFFLVLGVSADNCPATRHALCSDATPSRVLCNNFYQFYCDDNMVPLNHPVRCKYINGSKCTNTLPIPTNSYTGTCSPRCGSYGKSITLYSCGAFTTRNTCIASASSSGAWCFWDAPASLCRAASFSCY